ncbi:MAG: ankyrin repeat domain-containing protein [Betaproteobacteria bacterium]
MTQEPQNPGRRQLLAAVVLADADSLFQRLRQPKVDSYREWFEAVRVDDVRRVQALHARGFDPNSVEPERFDTALILSVRLKSSKVFSALLQTPDVNLNARSLNGDTALMIAAYLPDIPRALALITRGVEINRPGWTALHYAAASGSIPIIQRLLDESAFIDAESPNKTTPLMMAARSGHAAVVKLLLEEGADPTLKNEADMLAADFARAQGFKELARLLDAKAQP